MELFRIRITGLLQVRVLGSFVVYTHLAKRWCHVGVMRMVTNGGKWRLRLKREGESQLAPFDQNLLIPLDLSRLRQLVLKLGSRLLTEGLSRDPSRTLNREWTRR